MGYYFNYPISIILNYTTNVQSKDSLVSVFSTTDTFLLININILLFYYLIHSAAKLKVYSNAITIQKKVR